VTALRETDSLRAMRPCKLLALLIIATLFFGSFASFASYAHAQPQSNLAVTLGAALTQNPSATRFHTALHGDILFGRTSPWDFGIGPYADLATAWNDFSVGTGASLLLPIHDALPIVLSAGPFVRAFDSRESIGLSTDLFWGSRSFNYHGSYAMAFGLILQGRTAFGAEPDRALILGFRIDGQAFALPLLLAYGAITGGEP